MEALAEVAPAKAPAPKKTPEEQRAAKLESLAYARQCKQAKRAQSVADATGTLAELACAPPALDLSNVSVSEDVLVRLRDYQGGGSEAASLAPILWLVSNFAETDNPSKEVVQEFCRNPQQVVSSMTARALRMTVDRRKVPELLLKLASALVALDHDATKRLVEGIARLSDTYEPIMLLDTMSYDETPMETRTREQIFQISTTSGATIGGGAPEQPSTVVKATLLGSDVGPSKLLQSSSTVSILAKAKHTTEDSAKFLLVDAFPTTWVQIIESSSAEVLKAALEDITCASVGSIDASFKVRATTTDKLAANFKGERGLVRQRGPEWVSLHLSCDLHACSGAQTKTFALVDTFVTGMIQLSLSLRLSGNMARFRACVRRVVASKLVILNQPPSPDADAYRQKCLDLFVTGGADAARRRMLLWWWCNGDWQDHTSIQHFPGNRGDHGLSEEDICDQVTTAVMIALVGKAPTTFARHRWTGADISIDELGALQCVHGLLSHAYIAFVVACGHKEPRSWQYMQPRAETASPAGVLEQGDEGQQAQGDHSESDGEELQPDPQSRDRTTQAPDLQGQTECDWAAINAKARKEGFCFIKGLPLARLMLLRRCVEPFRKLMADHFRMGSEAWEARQRACEAASLSAGGPPPHRQFRVVAAAMHTLEDEFLCQLKELLGEEELWSMLPMEGRNLRFQALAFRLLSRMGCAVHELLYRVHDRFPYRLFLLLEDATLAEVFAEAKECELDSFTSAFLRRFPGEDGLKTDEARACLQAIARNLKLDIGEIESKHASLRRLLKGVPLAKRMSAQVLSATWACSRFSKRQCKCNGQGVNRELKKAKGKIKAGKQKRRVHGRTAFQAFVAEASAGTKADFKALYRRFQDLPDDERKRFSKAAAVSRTCARSTSERKVKPFGMSLQAAARCARLRRKSALWQQHRSAMSEAVRVKTICSQILASGADAQSAVRQATSEARFDQMQIRQRDEACAQTLKEFRKTHTTAESEAAASLVSAMPSLAAGLVRSPMASGHAFDFAPDSAAWAQQVLSFASKKPRANVSAALLMDWERRTRTISQAGLEPLPAETKEEKIANQCRVAGVCVCNERGKMLKNFCARLLSQCLKVRCGPGTEGRQSLMDGRLFLALQPMPAPEKGVLAPSLAPGSCLSHLQDIELWLHIGMMYLSPYKPTFQKMVLATSSEHHPPSAHLVGTGEFVSLHPAFEDVRLDCLWWAHLCVLVETVRPVGKVRPKDAYVKPSGSPILVWDPRRRARGGNKPHVGGHGAPAVQDVDKDAELQELSAGEEDEEILEEVDAALLDGPGEGEGAEDEEDFNSLFCAFLEEELEGIVEEGEDIDSVPADGAGEAAQPPNMRIFGAEAQDAVGGGSAASVANSPGAVVGADGLPADQALQGAPARPRQGEPLPAPQPHGGQGRGLGLHIVELHGGFITYYPETTKSKARFQANCGNPAHGRCRLTRAAVGHQRGGQRQAQGRPLGLMAAWLAAGISGMCSSKEDHDACIVFLHLEERAASRQELLLSPNGAALASCERERRRGEPEEPTELA